MQVRHHADHAESAETASKVVAKAMARARIACGRCRMPRTEVEWAALPPVMQVADAELATLVSRWPDHVVVVVRACTCGAPIARLAPRLGAVQGDGNRCDS